MSLSALLTAVVEYVGDVIVNDCGRPTPDRILRYFGNAGLPQDCCTEKGVLSIAFDRGWPTDAFPNDSSSKGAQCPSRPAYLLAVRYDVCWKTPEIDEDGMTIADGSWDADAAALSDVADCVARALIQLSCRSTENPKAQAVYEALTGVRDNFSFREVVPHVGGSCARLTWRAYAAPTAAPAS